MPRVTKGIPAQQTCAGGGGQVLPLARSQESGRYPDRGEMPLKQHPCCIISADQWENDGSDQTQGTCPCTKYAPPFPPSTPASLGLHLLHCAPFPATRDRQPGQRTPRPCTTRQEANPEPPHARHSPRAPCCTLLVGSMQASMGSGHNDDQHQHDTETHKSIFYTGHLPLCVCA